jgi:hypothetical protein
LFGKWSRHEVIEVYDDVLKIQERCPVHEAHAAGFSTTASSIFSLSYRLGCFNQRKNLCLPSKSRDHTSRIRVLYHITQI